MKKLLSTLIAVVLFVTMGFFASACDKVPNGTGGGTGGGNHITFEPITFTYNYNDATGNNTDESIEIKHEDLAETTLVVPEREDFAFKGWYADWLFNTQVSDEQGNLVIGDELFKTNSTQLFAKWLYNDYATYEILMVYVTEFEATLERYWNAPHPPIDVHYIMTDVERQIYEMIGPMLEQYLNALLNGLVVFQVDTFFTTEPLGINNITPGVGSWRDTDGTLFYNYGISAWNIPEIGGVAWEPGKGINWSDIGGILRDYRSVITTFGMNDYNYILHQQAGSGGNKYATVHTEALFGGIPDNGIPSVEALLDQTKWANWWHRSVMALYLHEFTHTVELQLENAERNGIWGLHSVCNYFGNLIGSTRTWDMGIRENAYGVSMYGTPYITEIEIIRLFFLDEINIDGQTVGIPFSFWKDPLPNFY